MSIPGAASPLFLAATAAGPAGDFEISRSLRFNQPDSSFLNRTFGSSGNRTTWTWSGWVKRSDITTNARQVLFSADGGANDTDYFEFGFGGITDLTSSIYWSQYTVASNSAAAFRDSSAWYHVVANYNGANLTFYVNNVQVLQSAKTGNLGINGAWEHGISRNANSGGVRYFSGYLAEVNLIDGSALDPTSFGQADANGVWQAKDTSGLSFGTNGFRLKFADTSSNAALGTDSSGNSNTWTVNNLSVGAVSNPTAKQNFDVVTWTGTGSAQSISNLAFAPDFIWIKRRSASYGHILVDTVRGLNNGHAGVLYSNATNAEDTGATQSVTAFNSNGFTLGTDGGVNYSGSTYVAWCWKAGGAASSNTNGTITSSCSANASYGFSITTWTGDGNNNKSVGHGLSTAPKLVVIKCRSSATSWHTYVEALDSTGRYGLYLNSNSASVDFGAPFFNADSSKINLFGGSSIGINGNGSTYVAYCWSEISNFSKFGSYTGTGAGGNTVTTGFKPKFVIIKASSSSTNAGWGLYQEGATDQQLMANCSGEEGVKGDCQVGSAKRDIQANVTFNDNGFTLSSGWSEQNASGTTYIYAAFAATVDESAINDCFVDTPSNAAEPTDTGAGGEVVGNYCTWNPIAREANRFTFANGNLNVSGNAQDYGISGTLFVGGSGKYYFELSCNTNVTYPVLGVVSAKAVATDMHDGSIANGLEYGGPVYGFMPGYGPRIVTQTTTNTWSGVSQSTPAAGDIYGVAIDFDNGAIYFAKNGTWLSSGNPASGSSKTGAAFTSIEAGDYTPLIHDWGSGDTINFDLNAGQRAFSYTAPSGYKSLNTANLPTPTIADGSQYFDADLYTGTGSALERSNLSFNPDFLWFKQRSGGGTSHALFDVIRGGNKRLQSNNANDEVDVAQYGGGVTSFDSDGFTLGTWTSINASTETYVAWAWDAGTSTVTNNDGSIASQVRAQPSAGFSICTYTGNGTGGASIGHKLNDAPSVVLVKRRNSSAYWEMFHASVGNTKTLYLNVTDAATTSSASWNNTSPTSSVFTLGNSSGTNASGSTYVAYCFAPVAGYSAMGSYVGNGSTDGVFVHTGFKVAFLLTKRTDTSENWEIRDIRRNPFNRTNRALFPHASGAEDNGSVDFDFLSNGFKLRNVNGSTNANGGTYLYYAVSANPFQANGGLAR